MSIVAFTLRSGTTQAAAPFTLGHAFKKGDVPAGSQVVADIAAFQCVPKNVWPDGSLKFAILSGRAAITAGVPLTVTLSIGTPTGGTALTIADLKATGIAAVTDAVAFGSAAWAGTDWDSSWQSWVSGPQMSSWVYRKQVGSDAHLVGFNEVRLYAGGAVEVLPWVENGYLLVAGPTRKNALFSFTLGGTQRFSDYVGNVIAVTYGGGATLTAPFGNSASGAVRVRSGSLFGTATWQSIDGNGVSTYAMAWDSANPGALSSLTVLGIMHHQRTPLISGAALSYWLGTDPGVTPRHDVTYLMATELVPTYIGSGTAAGYTAAAYVFGAYTPFQAGGFIYDGDWMGSSGYQRPIGLLPSHDVAYLTGNDNPELLFASVVRNGFSAGRYPTHYRDEGNDNRPVKFSQRAMLCLAEGSGYYNAGTTNGGYTPTPSGGHVTWDTSHAPSVGYMAYLLTGRWYFMEEMQFAAGIDFMGQNQVTRDSAKNLQYPKVGGWQTRNMAWAWRTMAQALATTPDADTGMRNEYIASLQHNIDNLHATYIAQANNPYGFLVPGESYDGGSRKFQAPWQSDFVTAAVGMSLSLDLPLSSTHKTKLAEFFQWKARSAVLRLGTADKFWYVNAPAYALNISPVSNPDYAGGTGPWYATEAEIYTATYTTPTRLTSTTYTHLGSTDGVLAGEIMPGADSMWGNLQPAIAYAARHEVPGAAEAYARMTGASNWAALEAQFDSVPVWGVVPASISAPAESAPMGPTLNIDVVSRFPGKLVIGNTGLGVLGKDVAGPVNGVPGYMYGVFDDVLHADREVSGPILTRPSAGNFKAYEDGAYSFTDAPDGIYNFTFQPTVGAQNYGPVLTEELVVGGTQAVAAWTEGADIIAVAGTFTEGVAASIGWTEGSDIIEVAATYEDGIAAVIGWTEGEDLVEAILEFLAATPVTGSIGWTESGDIIESIANVAVPVNENGLAISLAEARYCARVDGTEHDIGLLIAIATYAGEAEHITGRKIINTPYTLKFDTFPDAIQIPATPLDSIVSFKYVDVNGDEQDLPAEAYRVDDMDRITPAFGTTWPPTAAVADAVKVNLVCGYGANHTTTPNGIKSFIMARIAEHFNPPKSPRPDYAKGLLDPFKVYNR